MLLCAQEQIFGHDHPDTLSTRKTLAAAYAAAKRVDRPSPTASEQAVHALGQFATRFPLLPPRLLPDCDRPEDDTSVRDARHRAFVLTAAVELASHAQRHPVRSRRSATSSTPSAESLYALVTAKHGAGLLGRATAVPADGPACDARARLPLRMTRALLGAIAEGRFSRDPQARMWTLAGRDGVARCPPRGATSPPMVPVAAGPGRRRAEVGKQARTGERASASAKRPPAPCCRRCSRPSTATPSTRSATPTPFTAAFRASRPSIPFRFLFARSASPCPLRPDPPTLALLTACTALP